LIADRLVIITDGNEIVQKLISKNVAKLN